MFETPAAEISVSETSDAETPQSEIGRPRVLDDVKRLQICDMVAFGCSTAAAAKFVGCSPRTIRREALENEVFGHQLRNARREAQLVPLAAIRNAAATNWRAAAWLLERTAPERFGRPAPS